MFSYTKHVYFSAELFHQYIYCVATNKFQNLLNIFYLFFPQLHKYIKLLMDCCYRICELLTAINSCALNIQENLQI